MHQDHTGSNSMLINLPSESTNTLLLTTTVLMVFVGCYCFMRIQHNFKFSGFCLSYIFIFVELGPPLNAWISNFYLSIYLSGLVAAVAVFRNPNTIPFCLATDLLLNVLFSWLLVHLPSTFFLDVLFFFFPLVSSP